SVGSGKPVLNAEQPNTWALMQNHPNPFNPSTSINYNVPNGVSVPVTLKVFDIRGTHVRTLVNEVKNAGIYSVLWNGRDDAGRIVSGGIYFYRMEAGNFSQTCKMIFLK
ncbi:MAG: FlgD immunoglobulin-like domain containing protein, partial [Candidatus Latescibacter sp.]|nr:FlgD immunoglobulin-like domain containing protein [Candidatus Latescibacter sp.]